MNRCAICGNYDEEDFGGVFVKIENIIMFLCEDCLNVQLKLDKEIYYA